MRLHEKLRLGGLRILIQPLHAMKNLGRAKLRLSRERRAKLGSGWGLTPGTRAELGSLIGFSGIAYWHRQQPGRRETTTRGIRLYLLKIFYTRVFIAN